MFMRMFFVLAILMLTPQITFAESKCQGMTKAQAERSKDCIWVKGYKRADGTKVDGYARLKPSSDGKAKPKKEAKKKTKKKVDKKAKKDEKPKKEKKVKKEKKEKKTKKEKKPKKDTKKKDKKKPKKAKKS